MGKFFKIAVDLDDLRKANDSTKKNLIRGRYIGNLFGARVMGPGESRGKPWLGPFTLGDNGSPLDRKIISKGDFGKFLTKEFKMAPMTTKKGRETLNRVTLEHEGFEGKAVRGSKKQLFNFGGHMSPSVVLREHNVLTTLKGNKEDIDSTKGVFKKLRGSSMFLGDDTNRLIQEVFSGYEHGESPRLSRHAIKNITRNIIESKNREVAEDAVRLKATKQLTADFWAGSKSSSPPSTFSKLKSIFNRARKIGLVRH